MSKLDPKQIKFLEGYVSPKSETFGNALQSALAAGYSVEYAENITHLMPKWLSENIGDMKMLKKAERNIEELLDEKENLKVKADITKFVASTLGKRKYSSRQEISGPDGEPLILPSVIIDKNNL